MISAFEIYDNVLCVKAGWLISEGIMTKPIYDAESRKRLLHILRRGGNSHPALVWYDSIPLRFKEKIIEKIGGDPNKIFEFDELKKTKNP